MTLIRIAVGLACCVTAWAQQPQPVIDLTDWPVKISSEAQLFADDYLIAKQTGITFRLHPAEKREAPLIVPSPEWERTVLAYGSILRDGASGKLRMWYTNDTGIAYAESSGG